MVKSIAAVIGAYLLSIVLVFATGQLLSHLMPAEFAPGHLPSDAALATSTGLFVVVSILCAWLCARFAPTHPGRHVLWFMIIGEVMGIAMTIPNWGRAGRTGTGCRGC